MIDLSASFEAHLMAALSPEGQAKSSPKQTSEATYNVEVRAAAPTVLIYWLTASAPNQ